MSRPLRLTFPGAVYHITSRGNARQSIVADDTDRASFFAVLRHVVGRYEWLCHAYCLMDNHYHIVIETPQPNLSLGMRQLNGLYTQVFNRRHGRVGHLLQGRFKAILVEKDAHLLEVCRYVVLNPVRARMVAMPEEWPWTSYRATVGYAEKPDYLTTGTLLAHFGTGLQEAQARFRAFVMEIRTSAPWSLLKGQIYFGTDVFVTRHQPDRLIPEVPREQTIAARPPLVDVFSSNTTRAEGVLKACQRYGYRLNEVARHLGVHYATVSRDLKKAERALSQCKT